MIKYVKTDEELAKANRIGKHRTKKGLIVDPISYTGISGSFNMVYDGERYIPEFLTREYSLAGLGGLDYLELERIIIGNKKKE